MKRIRARELLNYSTSELWDIICQPCVLVFDDGVEVESTDREILYSSYFWDFHRKYPNTPLKHYHHVAYVLKVKL